MHSLEHKHRRYQLSIKNPSKKGFSWVFLEWTQPFHLLPQKSTFLFWHLWWSPGVAKKDLPKIIRILGSSPMSIIIKSTGTWYSPTLTGTSSNTPIGYLTDLSTSYNYTSVGFMSPTSNILHTDKGIKLTLSPRSQNALSKSMVPIWQGIKKLFRSLSLVLPCYELRHYYQVSWP